MGLVFQAYLQNRLDVIVIESVKEHLPLPSPPHQGQLAEVTQMMGDGRIARPQEGGEITDAHLPAPQGQKKAQPRRIAQGLEHGGKIFGHPQWPGLVAGPPDPFGMDAVN